MAIFNPDVKTPGDPSYLSYSKETAGKTSLSGLVKGIGNTAITTINTLDEINQEQIQAEIKAGAGLGDPDLATSSVPQETAERPDETADVFGEEKTAATVPEINQGATKASRLTQAYKQGKISATAYWGQMAALSKSLKARYAGYSDVIDRQFQGVTGQLPANALANAQRKQVLKEAATASSEEKQFNSFIKSNIQYLPPDYFDAIKAGTPYTKLDTYSYVHKVRAKDHELNYKKDQLAIAASEGNLVQEEAIGQAQNTLNARTDAILGATATTQLIEAIRAAQAKGSTVTPQEKEQIRIGYAQLKSKMEEAVEAELRKPSSDGSHTYYSLIKDPGKVKAIKEQALSRLSFIQEMVEDDKYGVLGATLQNVKALQDDASNRVLQSHDFFALADAVNKNGGGPLMAKMFADPVMAKVQGDAGKALVQLMGAKTAAGVPQPTVDKVKEIMSQPNVAVEHKKQQARATIETEINNLISTDSTNVSGTTAAENLYGLGNTNFLAHLPPAQQAEYYGKLVSEPVSKRMSALKAIRPELWNSYREWAKASFIALQRANAATIQEGISERQNVVVEWDGKENQFRVKLSGKGLENEAKQARGEDTFLSGVEEAYATQTFRAASEMNKQIKILEGVLKYDGVDVSKELATLLGSMDISMLTPKQKTFYQKARDAIDGYLNPPETGDEKKKMR